MSKIIFSLTKEENKFPPLWILIVSAIFALMEIMVGIFICFDPQSVLETLDLGASGVYFLVYMWGSRQFALGFIFAVATFKKSKPMLTLSYIFFLVMFIADVIIGILQKENSMIISALIMCAISSAMLIVLNRRK